MEKLSQSLQENLTTLKTLLPSEDILTFEFTSKDEKVSFTLVYADGIVDKHLLGELVIRPLANSIFSSASATHIRKALLFPETQLESEIDKIAEEILEGDALLLIDSSPVGIVVGTKALPARSVQEPPTDINIKGPREGFVEDVKTNMGLVRKRLHAPELKMHLLKIGRRSKTNVAVCYLDGIADKKVVDGINQKLQEIDTDIIVDSSYIADFLSSRKRSIFRTAGTSEKPDIFTAKIAEGRVGLLVDGSPVALTFPYLLAEDFQTGEDYFVSPYLATTKRILRFLAVCVSLLLPAFYVASQLFKLQLFPLGLTLNIVASIQGIPLSPSLEMFLVLFVLEVIKEASVRMPKYVGMALSIVGALVLGDTAVTAGFVSTPAIIVIAFSGLCLYTTPNFVETGSLLRWLFLIVAGTVGPFGIVLTVAFLLYYLVSVESYGAPLLAPFAPLEKHDLKDGLVKYNFQSLKERPKIFRSKNKTRMNPTGEK